MKRAIFYEEEGIKLLVGYVDDKNLGAD